MNIMINVSDMIGYATINDAQIPITTSRDYTGQAIVATGNTLAIGGLDSLRNSTTTKKVPFLGSLPGIGYLFKNDSTENSKSNLIMFITASVLNGYNGGVKKANGIDDMLGELDKVLDNRPAPTAQKAYIGTTVAPAANATATVSAPATTATATVVAPAASPVPAVSASASVSTSSASSAKPAKSGKYLLGK
jgi:Flp pilus assembly secretin CpaC